MKSNLGVRAVSLFVAIVIWFGIFGSKNIEITKEIAVRIDRPDYLVPANEIPEKVLVKFVGPKAFLRSVLDRAEEPIVIPFSKKDAGVHTYRIPNEINGLPLGVRVTSIQPQTITVRLDLVRQKTVPLQLELEGEPRAGFKVAKAYLVPDRVKIRGPRSHLARMEFVTIRPVSVADLRESIRHPVTFDVLPPGVEIEGAPPDVVIEVVSSLADGNNFRVRRVPVRLVGGKADFDPTKVQIAFSVKGTASATSFKASSFSAVVDLRGLSKGPHKVRVAVGAPPGVVIHKVSPPEVQVILH